MMYETHCTDLFVYLVDTRCLAVAFVADGTTATDSFVPGSDPCIASVGLYARISCQYRNYLSESLRRFTAFSSRCIHNSLSVESVGSNTVLVYALLVVTALCTGHLFHPVGIDIPEPGNDSFADRFSDNVSVAN